MDAVLAVCESKAPTGSRGQHTWLCMVAASQLNGVLMLPVGFVTRVLEWFYRGASGAGWFGECE